MCNLWLVCVSFFNGVDMFSLQQIEVLKMKLSKVESSEVTHNGWTDASVPDNHELSQDLPSPEQCDGHQLEYNDPLLQPVRGVKFNWEPLRSVSQCQCGSPFSFAHRKVSR